MKTVFPTPLYEFEAEEAVLKGAVEMACDGLVQVHEVESAKLPLLADVLARAILEKFNDGERDASLLAEHATQQALKRLGRKPN